MVGAVSAQAALTVRPCPVLRPLLQPPTSVVPNQRAEDILWYTETFSKSLLGDSQAASVTRLHSFSAFIIYPKDSAYLGTKEQPLGEQ